MQISRHLLLACAIATCLTPTFLRAYDTEAQIRARQALEDKMKQIEAQAPVTNSAPPAMIMKPTAPPPKPKKAKPPVQQSAPPAPPAPVTPPPVVAVPAVPATPAEPAAETPPAQPATSFAPEISQPATPAPSVTSTPAYNWSATSSPDTGANDKLREALHEKMSQTPTPPEVATQPKKATKPAPVMQPETHITATPAPVAQPALEPIYNTPAPVAEPNIAPTLPSVGLPTLTGPASSLPAAKQQKLDALLQQYRADQLTPQQYHEQRAKILSEP